MIILLKYVASNIGYLREYKKWIRQYSEVFFVLNNEGKVISWQFTNGTSFAEIQMLLTNLKYRFETLGAKVQKVTVDNCCQWRNKIQVIFGNSTSECMFRCISCCAKNFKSTAKETSIIS